MVMIGAALAVTGLLLWLFERRIRDGLGLLPTKTRLLDFSFGFLASALLAGLGFYLVAFITHAVLTLNNEFTLQIFFSSTLWMFRSVLLEELLFRGALLYIAISWIGVRRACFLSSVAFGVYHWFSYGVFGQAVPMIYVFLLTGVGGLMFAYAFSLTKSMYLPLGLHLGWNVVSVVVFSEGPLGNQLLIATGGQPLGLWTIAFFVYQVTALPFVTFLYLRREWLLVRAVKETSEAKG
jgi:membrane protease YdiL (CAAX protease family)